MATKRLNDLRAEYPTSYQGRGSGCMSFSCWLSDPLMAVIGSYNLDLHNVGEGTALVHIYHITDMTSFGHGLFNPPNELRDMERNPLFGVTPPLSNISQDFWFVESLP